MSGSSSFTATNCPEIILAASLAVIGGRADDRTMAELVLPMLVFRLLTALGAAVTSASNVAKDCMALTACPVDVLLRLAWLMTVTPDRADAGGSVPNGAVTETET